MTLNEFAALKVGDKIENAMSQSAGEVVEVNATGVRVRWSGIGKVVAPGNSVAFTYGVNSTSWMHWSKPPKLCPNGNNVHCTDPERCTHSDQCLGGDYGAIAGGASR